MENTAAQVSPWHNASRPHDVNQDRNVTPIDALLVVNTLNAGGARVLSAAEGEPTALVDVNGDSQVTPVDCLAVVNKLNQESADGDTVDQASGHVPSLTEVSVGVETTDDGTGDMGTGDDGSVDTGTGDDESGDTETGATSTGEDGTVDSDTGDDGTAGDGTTDDGTTDDEVTDHRGCGGSHESRLADLFDHADANDDGGLTEDELPQQLWERLSGADTNEDGSITLDELTAFKRDGGPHGTREDLFARLDKDGNGALAEDELSAQLWERLSDADTDGDGNITLEELTAFTPDRPSGPRHGGHGDGGGRGDCDVFARFDENDDGLLTADELPEDIWTRISPADTDGDSAVSAEELAAYRPESPPRPGIAPTESTAASPESAWQQRGPAAHRGGGHMAVMTFGGNARRA